MRNIEEIRILRSYELTMGAVQALLQACPRLKVLAEMDGWEGITEQELVRLAFWYQASILTGWDQHYSCCIWQM